MSCACKYPVVGPGIQTDQSVYLAVLVLVISRHTLLTCAPPVCIEQVSLWCDNGLPCLLSQGSGTPCHSILPLLSVSPRLGWRVQIGVTVCLPVTSPGGQSEDDHVCGHTKSTTTGTHLDWDYSVSSDCVTQRVSLFWSWWTTQRPHLTNLTATNCNTWLYRRVVH